MSRAFAFAPWAKRLRIDEGLQKYAEEKSSASASGMEDGVIGGETLWKPFFRMVSRGRWLDFA